MIMIMLQIVDTECNIHSYIVVIMACARILVVLVVVDEQRDAEGMQQHVWEEMWKLKCNKQ